MTDQIRSFNENNHLGLTLEPSFPNGVETTSVTFADKSRVTMNGNGTSTVTDTFGKTRELGVGETGVMGGLTVAHPFGDTVMVSGLGIDTTAPHTLQSLSMLLHSDAGHVQFINSQRSADVTVS